MLLVRLAFENLISLFMAFDMSLKKNGKKDEIKYKVKLCSQKFNEIY